jgi:hypothetical protein
LSMDERTPYGSICDLQHLLHVRSSLCYVVQLGTYLSCSTVETYLCSKKKLPNSSQSPTATAMFLYCDV